MIKSHSVPVIKDNTCIGATPGGIPITIGDITYMSTWKSPCLFNIYKKNTTTLSRPIATTGTTIKDVDIIDLSRQQILNPSVAIVATTICSEQLNKIVIDFFDKNVWQNEKTKYTKQEKWKLFDFYMTSYTKNCIGRERWNDNSLVYWRNVAVTLKC